MATYTSNYAWTKPEGSDPVDIGVLNNNLDSQDSIVHNAYMQLAPVFSTASTYAVDDVVLYSNNLYKCHTAVTVAGDWDATKWTQVKVSDIAGGGGGGGTSDYTDLTNKPQINGVTLSGNKSTSDLGIDKSAVGLSNVPNVATDDQTPTFTTAQSRNNLVSGEKLSVMLGKISKFFNDLKTVAFTGSYADLSNKPETTVIDWADWILLTPQEQESGDYTVVGCPWADGDVSVELMTKLWENESPTASFAAQDVNVESGYNYLIYARASASNTSVVSNLSDGDGYLTLAQAGNGSTSYDRKYTYANGKISFADAHLAVGTTVYSTNNSVLIPIAIYGIKTTASVKINAVAMDVNTSADHCMLSDGVTSVEDFVNEIGSADGKIIASVTADGVKSYSALFQELYPLRESNCKLRIGGSINLFGITANNYGSTMYGSSTGCNIYCVQLQNGAYYRYSVTTSGVSVTNQGSDIPSQGTIIRLYR